LKTTGDHIRKTRLDRGLHLKELVEHLGVNETSIGNWERNATEPEIRFLPAIIQFIGYNPFPEADDLANKFACAAGEVAMPSGMAPAESAASWIKLRPLSGRSMINSGGKDCPL